MWFKSGTPDVSLKWHDVQCSSSDIRASKVHVRATNHAGDRHGRAATTTPSLAKAGVTLEARMTACTGLRLLAVRLDVRLSDM